jgi:hypothetical protein
MHAGKLVFAQIIERVHHWEFRRLVRRHGLDSGRMRFTPWEQFLALCFAQLTFRESLRDIESCLGAQPHIAYHLGFRSRVTRSTLADANEQRDWRLFAAVAQCLMARARRLYRDEPNALDIDATIYALDGSLIDLSLALCPWANWTGNDAAVKLHALLDLRGPLPAFVTITEGERSEVTVLDELPIEPGSFYVMDRGYVDLRRLRRIAQAGAFFVIRERADIHYYVAASRKVDRETTNLRSDQSIRFNGEDSAANWPELMRRVSIFDAEHSRRLAFWTNQWTLPAATIAELYKQRWQVEIFFRWIKQNLRIRAFYGTTPNAVRVQLWTAISAYLAVAITRKQLKLSASLTTVLQIISVHALQKVPISELFAESDTTPSPLNTPSQLTFNDL